MLSPVIYLVFFSACDQKNTIECDPSAIAEGESHLMLDGQDQVYDSSWLMAGSALQINLESPATGSMITLRMNQTDNGVPADEVNEFPAMFSLGNPEIGSATLYFTEQSGSATTDADTLGTFELASWSKSVGACFSFSVFDQTGERHDIDSGLMNASESSLN